MLFRAIIKWNVSQSLLSSSLSKDLSQVVAIMDMEMEDMNMSTSEIGLEKFLVNELAQPPFNLDFTVASFTNLSSAEMIHLLTAIMAEIDPEQGKVDLSHEDESATLSRVLEFLRVLKYQPPHDDPHFVRDRILSGDADFLVPVMAWMLSRKEDLKIRAYLANYLVKITIPDEEWWADAEVGCTYDKYETLLEEFKAIHKLCLKSQSDRMNPADLQIDAQNMEKDIDCVQRKLDGMKFRLNESGQATLLLTAVHDLRMAGLKVEELGDQERNQERICEELAIQQEEFRNLYLDECNNNNLAESGQELLDRSIEENNRLRTLMQEKCPFEYDVLRRRVHALELVDEQAPGSNRDLNCLKDKVQMVRDQILEVQNMQKVRESDQDLFVLRQKAKAIQQKKLGLYAQWKPVMEELTSLKSQIGYALKKRRKKQKRDAQLEQEYMAYVEYVQNKDDHCAQMQVELNTLRKETGTLSTTKFIIDGQWRETEKELEDLEVRLGLSGFYENPEKVLGLGKYNDPEFEKKKDQLYEMIKNVKQIMDTVRVKKDGLEPLLEEVNQVRQQVAMMQMDHTEAKKRFDSFCLSLEVGNKELRSRSTAFKKEWETNQFKLVQLKCLLAQLNVTRFRVTEETVSQSLSFHGFRDKLTVKILEQERIQKQLEKDRAELDEFLVGSSHQKQLWSNVVRLLQWKRKLPTGTRCPGASHAHDLGSGELDHYQDQDQDYLCYDNEGYDDSQDFAS